MPPTGASTSKKFSITNVTIWLAVLVLTNLKLVLAELPWERWTWSMPQGPIEHFFRRQSNMPFKAPPPLFKCKCPPHDECKVEFQLNEDAIEFLNLRGVLKDKDVQQYKDDIKLLKERTKMTVKPNRYRRSETPLPDNRCCCTPKTIMMTTFITEKRFNDAMENIQYNKKNI